MLKFLRKKGFAKKVLWFVAIVIIISFGFFGTAYLLTGTSRVNHAGEIFGKKISFNDFDKAYRQVVLQAKNLYKGNYFKVRQSLNLQAETWDRLILLHEAKKMRIKVSDEDVIKAIAQNEIFQRNGQFDTLLYNDILRNFFRTVPREYEESVRENLKFSQLYAIETSAITASEDEVLLEYKKQNERIQISYILVTPDQFLNQAKYSESEAQKYFEEHKLDYLKAPSINVDYIKLPFPGIEDESDELELELEKDKLREQAESIYQELLISSDLNEVAQGQGLKVENSGFFSFEKPNFSLGWSFEILNKIFQLGLKEISEPLEASSGIFIVQVVDIKEPYVPEYNEIKSEIRDAYLRIEAKEIARKKVKDYLQSIHEERVNNSNFEFPKTAKNLGLQIYQTPVFNRGQYLPKIGLSKEFQEAAYRLNEDNKTSGVVETSVGFCILYLDNKVPAQMDQYEEKKEDLAKAILNERRNKAFFDFLTALRLEANLIDNISQNNQAQRKGS